MLEIEIDGKKGQVPNGCMVIEAAQQMGIVIPYFCYHKKLSIAASCRMCLVEINKASKPLPACSTPVTHGMKVFTHSQMAVTAQKGVMEFLLINHPLDCPVCDQGGECLLQDFSIGYGADASRYAEVKRAVVRKDVGPLIAAEEMTRCIHCTRCVRFGQEIGGIMELGMTGRNMEVEIQTFLGRSVDSELSGNMIDLCPVGALTSRPFRFTARSWELSQRKSVSPHDALGSNLSVQVLNDKVMRVLPFENEAINECWLSDKDRFSYEALNSGERLLKPAIKQGGAWHEVEWNVALDYVAHGLRDIASEHGANTIAALASPHSTLEELALLAKITRRLGSGNIDFRPRQSDFAADGKRLGAHWLGMRIADVQTLDAALVVGSFLRKDHPLLAQRLRLAARERAKVSLLSVTGDDPLIKLHAKWAVAPSQLVAALAAVVKAAAEISGETVPVGVEPVSVSDAARRMAQSLIDGKKKAIFLGNVATQSPAASQLHALALELGRFTGAIVGFLGEAANSVGGYLAGALPSATKATNARQMFEQPRQAYVLMGVEPEFDCHNPQLALAALRQAKMVVMMSAFKHVPALEYADVMLPLAPFTETSGTFVNCEGRAQSFNGAVKPRGDCRPGWKVLRVLGNVLDLAGFDYQTSEQVRDEILGQGAEFAGGLDNGLSGIGLTLPAATAGLERIADVSIHFADPLVRRAPSLQKTRDAAAPTARMHAATMARLGLVAGALVRVRQGQGEVTLPATVDNDVPENCVRVSAAHASTAVLGEMFGSISVER